jgi:hypothetical protein
LVDIYILFLNFLRHQTMDKFQKYNSFNTNTPSSESYRNYVFDCWFLIYSAELAQAFGQTALMEKQGSFE